LDPPRGETYGEGEETEPRQDAEIGELSGIGVNPSLTLPDEGRLLRRVDMDTFVFGSAIELLAGLSSFVALFVATAFSHFRHTSSCLSND
jgi:hypothetical protein